MRLFGAKMTTEDARAVTTLFGQVRRAGEDILFLVEKLQAIQKLLSKSRAGFTGNEAAERFANELTAILGPAGEQSSFPFTKTI
jgi:hypothetical protein